jgi:PPP family 3-phenylpropionic acid transporter
MFTASTPNSRSLRFLTLAQAGLFASNGLTIPLMANHMHTVVAAPVAIGLLFAAQQAGGLLAPYIWGALSDRIGRRKPVIFTALALSATSLACVALAQHYWLMLIAQAVFGIASAGFSAGNLALVGDLIEDSQSRGRVLGLFRMSGSVAFAITAVCGGFIADAYGLWVPVALGATAQALGCLAVLGIGEATPRTEPTIASAATNDGTTSASDRRQVLLFFIVVFTWFYGMGAVAWQWPAYMRSIGYPQSSISALWGLAALCEVPSLAVAGRLADKWGRRPFLMGSLAAQGTVYALYQFVAPTWGIVPLQMIRAMSFSSYEAPALLVATELGLRARRGRYAGLYHTMAGFGGVVGSGVGGAIVSGWGYPFSFTIAGILMATVAFTVARRLPQRAPAG